MLGGSHLLKGAADSKHHWHRGAGDVAQLCDHHGDEVGRGHVVDQVQQLQVLDRLPVGQEVALPTIDGDKVVGVTWREEVTDSV